MPIAQLCLQVTDAANKLRKEFPRQIVTTEEGEQVRENLENYFTRALKPKLHQEFHNLCDDIVSETIGLIAYLRPESPHPPPLELYDELINHVGEYTSNFSAPLKSRLLVQLAIAYGAGWKRTAKSDIEEWDALWPGSIMELTDTAYNFIVRALNILNATVQGFDENAPVGEGLLDVDEIKKLYPPFITAEFICHQPNSNKQKYKDFQTIHNWQPEKGNLYHWLKQAIDGGGEQKDRKGLPFLQTNRFRNGLLFPRLKEEGRLDVGKMAFQKCCQCLRETEYNRGKFCEECNATQIIISKDRLIVPMVHAPRKFRRCREEKRFHVRLHFYEFEFRECPHCGVPLPQRPTTLLVQAKYAQYATPLTATIQHITEKGEL